MFIIGTKPQGCQVRIEIEVLHLHMYWRNRLLCV